MPDAALRRDRTLVAAALAAVLLLAWVYTLLGPGMGMTALEMTAMTPPPAWPGNVESSAHGAMNAMQPVAWTASYALLVVAMWWIMMIAMMLPSAAPMILLFASVNRKQREQQAPHVPTAVFAAGYVLAWGGFSLLATGLQWLLQRAALLSPMMASTSVTFGAVLLLGAGIYQLTPLKHACLRHCRSPVAFVMHHWRPGRRGALVMGLHHGLLCVGCCWVLMSLLFFGGVMNLYWIVALAVLVLLEKLVPAGHWLGNAVGVALILWGASLLVLSP